MKRIFSAADILLPREGSIYDAWAVIACDQFTQDRAYWDAAHAHAAGRPSALDIVLPEIDLARGDEMVGGIHAAMERHLAGTLTRVVRGMVLTRRTTPRMVRHGLLMAVDLEAYDYSAGSVSPIRATEGTIADRLPPRMKIRRGAALESPHILLLIDDPQRTVIEPLFAREKDFEPLYGFDLMLEGGSAEGWAITSAQDIEAISQALDALADPQAQAARYGQGIAPLLFAAGDGNHSLATAKACWEELKPTLSEEERQSHPARFALAEVGNLHDPALVFEPIHRVLFGVEPEEALRDFARYLKAHASGKGAQTFQAVFGRARVSAHTASAPHELPVGSLQMWLDDYLLRYPQAEADYIHGEAELLALAEKPSTLAFLLPAMDKSALFPAVMRSGALPRKTFSMGEARDKRYYLECRRIAP